MVQAKILAEVIITEILFVALGSDFFMHKKEVVTLILDLVRQPLLSISQTRIFPQWALLMPLIYLPPVLKMGCTLHFQAS